MKVASWSGVRKLCTYCLQRRLYSVKVPKQPTWIAIEPEKLPKDPVIDQDMIDHLERLSLVEFNNQAGIDRLSSAIKSANKLYMVNTDDVEPLDSVLEDRVLYLRNDEVSEGNCKKEILQNATKTIEDYFVAPPDTARLERDQILNTLTNSTGGYAGHIGNEFILKTGFSSLSSILTNSTCEKVIYHLKEKIESMEKMDEVQNSVT